MITFFIELKIWLQLYVLHLKIDRKFMSNESEVTNIQQQQQQQEVCFFSPEVFKPVLKFLY